MKPSRQLSKDDNVATMDSGPSSNPSDNATSVKSIDDVPGANVMVSPNACKPPSGINCAKSKPLIAVP